MDRYFNFFWDVFLNEKEFWLFPNQKVFNFIKLSNLGRSKNTRKDKFFSPQHNKKKITFFYRYQHYINRKNIINQYFDMITSYPEIFPLSKITSFIEKENLNDRQNRFYFLSYWIAFIKATNDQKYCQNYSKKEYFELLFKYFPNFDWEIKQTKRKCHDCGRPTYHYRCAKCREKIKKECDSLGYEEHKISLAINLD